MVGVFWWVWQGGLDNLCMNLSVFFALFSAVLFGLSTPLAKALLGALSPVMLAGLLYLGSGLGLALVRLLRDRGWRASGMPRAQWPWFWGAILLGGVAAPVLLMVGLGSTPGSVASLLLNLESVLTAMLAWVVFKEHTGPRMLLGMVAIVAGSLLLSWSAPAAVAGSGSGPLWISLACLCWALDNNLTRKVSASDALLIAASKGLVAGVVNTMLAWLWGASLPNAGVVLAAMLVGLLGYGISLVLFVLALRGLGAARTGAYFSLAPFMGAAVAVVFVGESTGSMFWLAAALMGWGLYLHLTEHHDHLHQHEALTHDHWHTHDAHHQHTHNIVWRGSGAHQHPHHHDALQHSHPHYPDMHHQHPH